MRVRRLIRVSAIGKVLGPRPSSTIHRMGTLIGATHSPANPTSMQAAHASTAGNGLFIRAHIVGPPNAPTRPISENNPTIAPPKAGLAPASPRMSGIQVNIE